MRDVFIVSAVRTPVGKQRGYYREYIAPELLALVLNEVVERVNLDVTLVDDVITGCVYQIGEQPLELSTDVGINYQFAASRTTDHAEAVKSFLEKRRPSFTGD